MVILVGCYISKFPLVSPDFLSGFWSSCWFSYISEFLCFCHIFGFCCFLLLCFCFAVMLPNLLSCLKMCCCASEFAAALPNLLSCFRICCHVSEFVVMLPNLLLCFRICCHVCEFAVVLPYLMPCFRICGHITEVTDVF